MAPHRFTFVGRGDLAALGSRIGEIDPWDGRIGPWRRHHADPGEQDNLRFPNHPANYRARPDLADAVNTALALSKPLLLTGNPGTGKSQLAERIAWELNLGPVLRFEAQSLSEANDLFYRFDLVGHLAAVEMFRLATKPEAPEEIATQIRGELATQIRNEPKPLAPERFVKLGPLGEAIVRSDPARYDVLFDAVFGPGERAAATAARPSVVLIDEIDKTSRDFPNDLLNGIERLEFRVRELGLAPMEVHPEHRPIVIITSNSERDLPAPFLRRCTFFHIPDPTRDELTDIVAQRFFADRRAEGGQGGPALPPFYRQLLERFWDFREQHQDELQYRPGTSELIDWTAALRAQAAAPDAALTEQIDLVRKTASAVSKHKDDHRILREFLEGFERAAGMSASAEPADARPRPGIADLVEALRAAGFPVGVSEAIDATQLLLTLGERGADLGDRDRLRSRLRPVFCKSGEQQEPFDAIFDDWWAGPERRRATTAAPAAAASSAPAALRSGPLSCALVGLALVALAGGLALALRPPRAEGASVPRSRAGAGRPGHAPRRPCRPSRRVRSDSGAAPSIASSPRSASTWSSGPSWIWLLGALPLLALLGVSLPALVLSRTRPAPAVGADVPRPGAARHRGAPPGASDAAGAGGPSRAARPQPRHRHRAAGPAAARGRAPHHRGHAPQPGHPGAALLHGPHPPLLPPARGRGQRAGPARPALLPVGGAARARRPRRGDPPARGAGATSDRAPRRSWSARRRQRARASAAGRSSRRSRAPRFGERLIVVSDGDPLVDEQGAWRPDALGSHFHRWRDRALFTPVEPRDWGAREEAIERAGERRGPRASSCCRWRSPPSARGRPGACPASSPR